MEQSPRDADPQRGGPSVDLDPSGIVTDTDKGPYRQRRQFSYSAVSRHDPVFRRPPAAAQWSTRVVAIDPDYPQAFVDVVGRQCADVHVREGTDEVILARVANLD